VSKNHQVYFEVADLDAALHTLCQESVRLVYPIIEQP
jgi:hypothetical protein